MSESAPTPTLIRLDADDAGGRIDRVLARRCPQFSRSALQRWIEQGRVEQAGEVVSRKTKAVDGAEVLIQPAPPEAMSAEPQAIPLQVLFEDDQLIVLDKPAGLVVHPAPGHPDGTLVNALLHHAAVQGGSDPLRPGIVHRLDKDTSGVMVVAKSSQAHEGLVEMFQQHRLERAYLAIALGRPPQSIRYETLHGRHPSNRKKFTSRTERGRRAVTDLESIELLHGSALVRCRLETGRTHQIRVHLAEHGHPVLGDALYGKSIGDPELRRVADELGRQALHATVLAFEHPITGKAMRFETEPPPDFENALRALRLD
ncbi:MAG: RluA family pseudouridine synthase [Deltaproteobacteria bacterium]|nr:RluA family pseudouridine synthase [Deltaproteobacteria bacterium]NND28415.1 RluA family pseudouridine synthase [Myxococcales bacterium]MBT8464176.1 RluA family pseudouridine synthase [Deltaproteobacteria bacterium]MBT8483394.1 RluA family pseudouridine synthase [Deltaproteobacteria bacterium]NNK08764.1 RluA family pseudouridine synthase [Myxococcales bacterium]